MEEQILDLGVQVYPLGAGELRFNPADPNLYVRFREALAELSAIQPAQEQDMLSWLQAADKQMKQILTGVFGQENDFEKLFPAVSLLAVSGNGKSVLENLLAFLEPILTAGIDRCVEMLTREILQQEGSV